MLPKVSCVIFFLMITGGSPAASGLPYILFNGFRNAELILNGSAKIKPSGLLQLTSSTRQQVGHAFYPTPFSFLNSSGKPFSFSTSFVFAIVPQYPDVSSEGLTFAISSTLKYSADIPSQFLGLFNLTDEQATDDGQVTDHFVAVKLDTVQNNEFNDTGDNQVGILVDSLVSIAAAPASFAYGPSSVQNLSLISGQPLRVWAEYDSMSMEFYVTIAPLDIPKPALPLLSIIVDLSSVFLADMHVGFTASTGEAPGSHNILGWSFSINGKETELTLSDLPSLSQGERVQKQSKAPIIWAPTCVALFLLITLIAILLVWKKRRKLAEVSEEWETGYGPRRFSFGDVHKATRGFSRENLLGSGGFGEVYKGILSKSKKEVAVKRISRNSKQGMKEFVAEIASIGRLRHRNLVQLLGYTRRRGVLILVYDYMPNGSLDKRLFCRDEEALTWEQRFNIIKGIAAGLLYLHEEWEQVVIHRDIKASNVLIDADFNGKLGDFGLARLHERGSTETTTRIIGTLGYLAPEVSRAGKSTTSSDVFAFGAFLLEVACGKRPVQLKTTGVELVLVDWVMEFLKRGELLEARDRRLGDKFVPEEVELVLKLGIMCSSQAAAARPRMRQVLQYLEGVAALPEMSANDLSMLATGDVILSVSRSFSGTGTGTWSAGVG